MLSLKALVVVWVLQLAVFALGVSLLPRRLHPDRQALAAKPEGDAIIRRGLESPAEKPA